MEPDYTRCMIVLSHVTRRFGGVVAIDDVSLHVAEGTTHVLLGTSGCGKSTILRMILGILPPDQGTIEVTGLAVTPETRAAVARRVGYVVQEGALYPHLSAFDNVALPAQAQGWPASRIAPRIDELTRLVGLPPALLSRPPQRLSGGERQRVGLMRALMLDPPVLLLDEPLGALDPIVRADLQTQLGELFRALAKTVVLVTHDVREAVVLGHTITLMTQGRVVQDGTFDDLRHRPTSPFVTEFLRAQAPPTAMVDGT
jgi:osmoprotectant transport system ATP-binding protein